MGKERLSSSISIWDSVVLNAGGSRLVNHYHLGVCRQLPDQLIRHVVSHDRCPSSSSVPQKLFWNIGNEWGASPCSLSEQHSAGNPMPSPTGPKKGQMPSVYAYDGILSGFQPIDYSMRSNRRLTPYCAVRTKRNRRPRALVCLPASGVGFPGTQQGPPYGGPPASAYRPSRPPARHAPRPTRKDHTMKNRLCFALLSVAIAAPAFAGTTLDDIRRCGISWAAFAAALYGAVRSFGLLTWIANVILSLAATYGIWVAIFGGFAVAGVGFYIAYKVIKAIMAFLAARGCTLTA